MTRKICISIGILTMSCAGKQDSASNLNKEATAINSTVGQNGFNEHVADTILERNAAGSIDLTKHQLFIDTTRNSEFYDELENWKESDDDRQSINATLETINKGFDPVAITLEKFPSQFIALRKLNGSFVLYERCDGMEPRFTIRDTAFVFYGSESEAESISNMISRTDDSIELQLKTLESRSSDQKSYLTIVKTDKYIFKMTYQNQSLDQIEYLTTPDMIHEFDLVVNHCPTMKMEEFNGFDREE